MALTKTPSELTAADLTITTAAQPNITSLGTLTTLTIDDITINGSTISDAADFTIDVGGDIILDADGGDIILKDGGTSFGQFSISSGDFYIQQPTADKDIVFRGLDDSTYISALTLDMSAAGAATFNDKVIADSFESTAGGTFTTASGNDLNIVYPDSRSLFIKEGSTTHVAVDNAGNVIIGGTAVHESRVNQKFALTHAAQRGGMMINSFYNSASGPIFDWNKSRNDTAGSHTVVQNGDALGTFIWRGDDGDEFVDSVAIEGNVDGPPGNGDMPGRLVFYTSPDGTGGLAENMRINSAGNVGIGDTVPAWGAAYRALTIGSSGSIWCSRSGTSLTAIGDNMYFDGSNNIARNAQAGAMYYMNAGAHVWQHAPSVSAGANQTFSTTMIMTSSGNLGVGTDSPGNVRLRVHSDVNGDFTQYILQDNAGGYGMGVRSDSGAMIYFYIGGTYQGHIYSSSGSTTYGQGSDYRLKENVVEMSGSIDNLKKLRPVTFNFKADEDSRPQQGFIAHEAQEVVPNAVTGQKDDPIDEENQTGYQSMDYGKVTPLLTSALQEAIARIETLEAEVKALKEA